MFVRLGFRKKVEPTQKKSKHTGKYETPTTLGAKWQMDVKYVPKVCHAGKDGKKFYQSNRRCDALPASFVPFLRFALSLFSLTSQGVCVSYPTHFLVILSVSHH